jgi:hypothetical protein
VVVLSVHGQYALVQRARFRELPSLLEIDRLLE